MLEELDKLINFIQMEYIQLTDKWEQSSNYSKINLKNNQVCDLLNNQLMLDTIVNYREFINQNNIQLSTDFIKFNSDSVKVNKCIDSSKDEYKATHIYFKKDNYAFQWELQVWNKKDEINNINSHAKYKQDYIKWENENIEKKGGKK